MLVSLGDVKTNYVLPCGDCCAWGQFGFSTRPWGFSFLNA
uniref:Uncharacterized protein n=1 Tax=Anguilla anguilla TaxID=7936 RepID=A0A0E9SV63_ANGAN